MMLTTTQVVVADVLRTIHRLSELTLLLCCHTVIVRMSVILVYGVIRCMTRISNILNRESSTFGGPYRDLGESSSRPASDGPGNSSKSGRRLFSVLTAERVWGWRMKRV